MPEIRERALEAAIEAALLAGGPDAVDVGTKEVDEKPAGYGEGTPGGYRKPAPEDYDRSLCLIPRDVLDFIYATQPKEWERLKEHHGEEVKERFLARLSREVQNRGVLDVLRKGVKDSGCKFQLAYFQPSGGLNEQLRTL